MNVIFLQECSKYFCQTQSEIPRSMEERSYIQKYNVPGPRYTSYPTVPYWTAQKLTGQEWLSTVNRNFKLNNSAEISLYIHLPFCESLCTFCGCHKRITKNHQVEIPYLTALLKEWQLYRQSLLFDPTIRELHLGGGTPTFFSPQNLDKFLEQLLQGQPLPDLNAFSFEAHPGNTSKEHLEVLQKHGFSRVSFGIQDYNPEVQQAIHRIQSPEEVNKIDRAAKNLGYKTSHDLVFGLPKQTLAHIRFTVNTTLELRPERISLYSYAHVPWIKGNGQRGFNDEDIPRGEAKRELYETAKTMLEKAGYVEIGMDHFALPDDALTTAFKNKTLHRNFMGYTTRSTSLLIGLGMSAISDSWFGFAQNHKDLSLYLQAVEQHHFPLEKGHVLTEEDLTIRQHILDLMCHFKTSFPTDWRNKSMYIDIFFRLQPLFEDGMVSLFDHHLLVSQRGLPFVRNICMAFDLRMHTGEKPENLFSQTI